jgi:hypothetical protein
VGAVRSGHVIEAFHLIVEWAALGIEFLAAATLVRSRHPGGPAWYRPLPISARKTRRLREL